MKNDVKILELSSLAVKSLIMEVSITPKPGLVDRNNSGAHNDMDFYTFIDSAFSLENYFYDVCNTAYNFPDDDLKKLFSKIRQLGVLAEKDMFIATNGINTHKGLIFSLGIFFSSTAYLLGKNEQICIENICNISKKMVDDITIKDFYNINIDNAKTVGEKLYAKYSITGIRGEAENGFPTVRNITYPNLKSCLKNGMSFNNSCVCSLIKTMCTLEDTNILGRHNYETLNNVMKKAIKISKIIDNNKLEINESILDLDEFFIMNNISPGGSADMLAITISAYFIEQKFGETLMQNF